MASTPSLPRTSAVPLAPGAAVSTPPEPTGIPVRTILLGVLGVSLIALGGAGAGAVLKTDPLLTDTSLSWVRYGHGRDLA
ncbi:MAG TPA: hypothetical protein VFZ92_23160, partial [Umezawaea sp.]